jgi:hypothetical protein
MMKSPGYVGASLASIAYILPQSIPGALYTTPTLSDDGALTYAQTAEPPPPIRGYLRCTDNPWKFLPQWLPCTTRYQAIVQHRSLGSIDIRMTCNNPGCPHLGKVVTDITCKKCPYREDFTSKVVASEIIYPPPRLFTVAEDGSVTYAKGDQWEPPREPNGYTRDPENAWRFIPIIWPACTLRTTKTLLKKNCGCWDFDVRCTCAECSLNTQPVTHLDCEKCAFRVDK